MLLMCVCFCLCVRSGSQALQQLPARWLSEVLEEVKSSDPSSKLCATRRSAGIPFYIQVCIHDFQTWNTTVGGRSITASSWCWTLDTLLSSSGGERLLFKFQTLESADAECLSVNSTFLRFSFYRVCGGVLFTLVYSINRIWPSLNTVILWCRLRSLRQS